MKRMLVVALFASLLALGMSACGSSSANSTSREASSAASSETSITVSSAASSSTPSSASTDAFITAVWEAIDGDASIEAGESITDVSFDDGKLVVKVDMGNSYDGQEGSNGLTRAQLMALSRFSSITDDILDMTEYDSMWNAVTVDFGANGSVTKTKAEAKDSGLGRYFDVKDSDLKL